ncbi:MAG: hypothetical protein JJU31_15665 [Wenzhouxiangella sp.]|nr:hypothetical protein [Wenzhouxiangella sp.]
MTRSLLAATLLLAASLAAEAAENGRSAEEIIAFATESAGGDRWRLARTNIMRGHATLCRDGQVAACVHADSYQMWRQYPEDMSDPHAGTGMFRLDAHIGERILFQTSFDGEHSWTHEGRVPAEQASVDQQSNFGFSAIRFAGREGFPVERLIDDMIDGHSSYTVRVHDPAGGSTLFWIDQDSGMVRAAAWPTPRGFHQRVYSEHYLVDPPGFKQPGRVRLYYDGVMTADVYWTEATIDEPIDPAWFRLQ